MQKFFKFLSIVKNSYHIKREIQLINKIKIYNNLKLNKYFSQKIDQLENKIDEGRNKPDEIHERVTVNRID